MKDTKCEITMDLQDTFRKHGFENYYLEIENESKNPENYLSLLPSEILRQVATLTMHEFSVQHIFSKIINS